MNNPLKTKTIIKLMVWEQERVFLAGEHLRKHSQNIEHKDSLSTAEHPKRKKQ